MTEHYVVQTQAVVSVTVTSTVNSFGSIKRFPKDLTITTLKGKLELLTGSVSANMKLELRSKDNKLVCEMTNDDVMLGSYPVEDNMIIHVVDPTMGTGAYEDLSTVKKFELTEEEYAKKSDSVRAFKQRMKMGQFKEVDPEEVKREAELKSKKEAEEKTLAESIKVGERCEVKLPEQLPKRGTVRYVGKTEFKPGHWVGIEYDEPHGKNDGSVKGKRYFECRAKYGGFVKPNQVAVGDFPEEDLGLDEM
ncbi:tubulin-folding cofactor B-like [Lineus longissimus]|uniref:tubulin-folding cofactor B-like n=1 Tax=Lineus longissimus TaxID=88925 RepID=UPI00315D2887